MGLMDQPETWVVLRLLLTEASLSLSAVSARGLDVVQPLTVSGVSTGTGDRTASHCQHRRPHIVRKSQQGDWRPLTVRKSQHGDWK